MGLDMPGLLEERKGSVSSSCSICLEFVVNLGDRSIAKLQCGHEFHLDCIGSAFNAKGAMQCPNCRKVEKGHWLYANGPRSSTDSDLDGWITENINDLGYTEFPFVLQWCPFRGFTALESLMEEGESLLNSYHDQSGSSTFRDQPSASNRTHGCPYLALHGFHQPRHVAPSTSSDSVPESAQFHRHPTSLAGQPSAEIFNPDNLSATEAQSTNWQQQPPHHSSLLVGNPDQDSSHYGLTLTRNDARNQQRRGSFLHPHPLGHGYMSAQNGSNLTAPSVAPPFMGEARGLARDQGSHIYEQPISSSSLRNPPFALVRRPRPRGWTLISTSPSTEIGRFYGFSVSSFTSWNPHDAERHFDRSHGWVSEGFTPLPWISGEGESQWWDPQNPIQAAQAESFLHRGTSGDRVGPNQSESGYHRYQMPPQPPPYT